MNMLKGKRILVIDDAEAERMLIGAYLQRQGCRLYHAHDGMDGIHKARLLLPDLILMDVDIPRCNGYAACRILKDDPLTAEVPVIFLSAYAEPADRVQGLLAGAVDYIAKPFDFDEMRLRLAVHLRNRMPHAAPSVPHAAACADDAAACASREASVALSHTTGSVPAGQARCSADSSHLHEILFHGARIHLLSALADVPNLPALASLVGTNTKRLNEAFRQCAGMTVFEYLREERMKAACQLLRSTGLSVGEVAARVGFSSSANFATAFKERFGLTPSGFRQQEHTEESQLSA